MNNPAIPRPASATAHAFGPNLTLHGWPYPLSLLARLGHPQTRQPEIGILCRRLFEYLFDQVASAELDAEVAEADTRMTALHPGQRYHGPLLRRRQKVVVVDVARAGIVPAQIFYERFNEVLEPELVRQDHLFVSRTVGLTGEVTGAAVAASKIGGPLTDALLVVPDPMGATGGSLKEAMTHYAKAAVGEPRRVVCVHLIVTPEYVRAVHAANPEVRIHAIRLDRGFSTAEALARLPGELPEGECGLDEHQYIVPGAGGLGEVLNNAWV